jgi:hypothetical protein
MMNPSKSRVDTLFKQLSDIKIVLESLVEKVSNTYPAVGGESMTACLEVYAYVQTAKDRVPGLKSVAYKLNTRVFKTLTRVNCVADECWSVKQISSLEDAKR